MGVLIRRGELSSCRRATGTCPPGTSAAFARARSVMLLMAVSLLDSGARGRVVTAGDRRADHERGQREHRGEHRYRDRGSAPGAEAPVEAEKKRDRRDEADRREQDRATSTGE